MIDQISTLNSKRWANARATAEGIIITRHIRQPKGSDFIASGSADAPIVTLMVMLALIVVALGAFYLSAAKEIVAVEAILTGMVNQSGRLGMSYVAPAILAVFALSEIGVLLFGVAADGDHPKPVRVILRGFQVACVVVALGANISVTLAYPAPSMQAFDWLITIIAPVAVIGVGLILEQQIISLARRRREAMTAYKAAMAAYDAQVADPQAHKDWRQVWGDCIVDEILKASKYNTETLPGLIDEDPSIKTRLFRREVARHSTDYSLIAVESEISGNFQKKSEISEHEKQPLTQAEATKILDDNPELVDLKDVELADKFGGSTSTWWRVKRRYSTPSNGNIGAYYEGGN